MFQQKMLRPENTAFAGKCNFELALDFPKEDFKSTANIVYSKSEKILFIRKDKDCPFKLRTSTPPPPGSYIKVFAVHKDDTHVLKDPVLKSLDAAKNDNRGKVIQYSNYSL